MKGWVFMSRNKDEKNKYNNIIKNLKLSAFSLRKDYTEESSVNEVANVFLLFFIYFVGVRFKGMQ